MQLSSSGPQPAPAISSDAKLAPIAHHDVATRTGSGRAARKETPRSSHAAWEPSADRADPVALLHAQEQSRVPDLVPIRHQRMLASPFAFYRGAAVIMAADLATLPNSGLRVQCCGDAHLANFGGFASPDRHLVFDINDFDETSHGPFEWDVKRLAASFEIAARAREFAAKDNRRVVLEAVRAYREAMAEFASKSNLDVWYARLDVEQLLSQFADQAKPKDVTRAQKLVAKATSRDNLRAFDKLTQVVDEQVKFASDPPLLVPARDLAGDIDEATLTEWVHERFRMYRHSLQADRRHLLEGYRIVDLARKVVGVGSVGTRCWVMLMLGKDDADPLLLQIKEAEQSVLEPYGGRSQYANHGQRVVEGQRLLQAASDIMLGWFQAHTFDDGDRDFYVRQLWDWKVSAAIETMTVDRMTLYARMCGWTLARAHARSGDRIAISSYLGANDVFDRAIADFATAYADQNERDYEVAATSLSSAA
jgi:uncharacterized protein (DUF2252 family)